MFATVPRMRSFRQQSQQEEEKPEPGMDSTYGVRSLASSWGGDSDQDHGNMTTADEECQGPEGESAAAAAAAAAGGEEVEVDAAVTGAVAEEWTPTTDRTTHLPPLDHHEGDDDDSPFTPDPPAVEQFSTTSAHGYGYLYDDSAPSSPASFASMPSYISSLSRTSSLAGTGRAHAEVGLAGGSEELVMPTLLVSSSSASAGPSAQLRPTARASGSAGGGGLKIVLLGDQKSTHQFINDLKAVKEVVHQPAAREDGSGEYAIIGGDEVVATLVTGLSGEDIETRVESAYSALDGVVHPNPSPAASAQLEELVLGYAAKSDWVHLLFVLDAESSTVTALAELMPTLASDRAADSKGLLQLPPLSPLAGMLSPSLGPDPTPRPDFAAQSYFSQPTHAHAPVGGEAVQHLIHALSHADTIRHASSAKFLAWRPTFSTRQQADLSSSQTSSHESSGLEYAPMPTVARAQGGGEWEANLSRRLAKRRQSDVPNTSTSYTAPPHLSASSASASSGKRRTSASATKERKKKKERDSCAPLFPPTNSNSNSNSASGSPLPLSTVGLGDLLEKTFGGLRRRWRWGVVAAAAVALVVGWNWVRAV